MSHRTFKDAGGQDWQVWDVLPERLVGHTLEAGWLTFQSADEKRRLTPVPLYWANAGDEELERLLATAKPVLEKPGLESTTENRPAPAP